MNTRNEYNTQTELSRVLEKITEIANASADGAYIYRGESKPHDDYLLKPLSRIQR